MIDYNVEEVYKMTVRSELAKKLGIEKVAEALDYYLFDKKVKDEFFRGYHDPKELANEIAERFIAATT